MKLAWDRAHWWVLVLAAIEFVGSVTREYVKKVMFFI
jgi:hypothetical protein